MVLTNGHRVVNMLILLVGLMALYTFIGFHMGYDGLVLVGEVQLAHLPRNILKVLIFAVQTFLIVSYSLDIYDIKSTTKLCLPFLAIWFVVEGFGSGFATSGIMPVIYVMALAIKRGIWKQSLCRTLVVNGAIIAYQVYSILIKTGHRMLGYATLTTYEWLITSIDLLLLILLIYTRGGVLHHAQLAFRGKQLMGRGRLERKLVVFPADISRSQGCNDRGGIAEETRALGRLKGFERLFAMSLLAGIQIFQFSVALLACRIGNVFIEGAVIATSYVAMGFVIQRRWHSTGLLKCTLLAAIMFYVSAKVTIAFQYSQFFPIIVGALLCYGMYRVGLIVEDKDAAKLRDRYGRAKGLEQKIELAKKTVDEIHQL